MLNELKTYADEVKESGHGMFFAVTSDEYTEWDRGSDDLAKAIEALKEADAFGENAEIAIIDVADGYCIDTMTLEEAEDELQRME